MSLLSTSSEDSQRSRDVEKVTIDLKKLLGEDVQVFCDDLQIQRRIDEALKHKDDEIMDEDDNEVMIVGEVEEGEKDDESELWSKKSFCPPS